MKLLLYVILICLPLLASGATMELTFSAGAVADTGINPLDELTFTLDYTHSANVNAADPGGPKAYSGACTESPPLTMVPLSGTSGISGLAFSVDQVVFAFDPLSVPAAWQDTVNHFLFCVYLLDSKGFVFEEVTVDLTLVHTSTNDTPVVSFVASSNDVIKTATFSVSGKDVMATAALCNTAITTFTVGEEICIRIGLDANGEYFGYKLDDGTPLEPFTDIAFTTGAGGPSTTVTPLTDQTRLVPIVGDPVNSQEIYFYLPSNFYYSGFRTVTANIKVNIVDAYGVGVTRRLTMFMLFDNNEEVPDDLRDDANTEELPDNVHENTWVEFNIVPMEGDAWYDNEVCVGVMTLIWILLVAITLCCCIAGCAGIRRKREKEEEEKTTTEAEIEAQARRMKSIAGADV